VLAPIAREVRSTRPGQPFKASGCQSVGSP
jgi:hypothetical protein